MKLNWRKLACFCFANTGGVNGLFLRTLRLRDDRGFFLLLRGVLECMLSFGIKISGKDDYNYDHYFSSC